MEEGKKRKAEKMAEDNILLDSPQLETMDQLLAENNYLRGEIYQLAEITQDIPTATDLNLLKIENSKLKDTLQQIHKELEEFNAPEKSAKEKEIESLRNFLEIQPDEKENINTFIAALEYGLLDHHEGRLAVFHEGYIMSATFESLDAFRSLKPLNDENSYSLYTVPGGKKPVITSYRSHAYVPIKGHEVATNIMNKNLEEVPTST